MTETLNLAFAFAWLLAVPSAHGQEPGPDVLLKSVSEEVIAEIRQLYFKTTARTIDDDFDRAIDLLKTIRLPEDRQRATVYMEGLAEMRREWKKRPSKRAT